MKKLCDSPFRRAVNVIIYYAKTSPPGQEIEAVKFLEALPLPYGKIPEIKELVYRYKKNIASEKRLKEFCGNPEKFFGNMK